MHFQIKTWIYTLKIVVLPCETSQNKLSRVNKVISYIIFVVRISKVIVKI